MQPLTHTDLFTVYVRGDEVIAPSEPITSEGEAARYVGGLISEHRNGIEGLTVLRATEAGVSDWTAETVAKAHWMGWFSGKSDTPECIHQFIEDPAYDREQAGYARADDTWAAE